MGVMERSMGNLRDMSDERGLAALGKDLANM
jgi:hypothetical protein